jgi:SAM-dependent methyltransferase
MHAFSPKKVHVTDSWDERYRRGGHEDQPPSDLLVRAASLLPPGRALDLACGTGRHAIFLAELGWDVLAVDKSSVAIERLRKRAPAVSARVEDLEVWMIPPAAFDLILDFLYLDRALFPGIKAGLRPGGVAVIEVRTSGTFRVAPGELRTYFEECEILECEEDAITARLIARAPISLPR